MLSMKCNLFALLLFLLFLPSFLTAQIYGEDDSQKVVTILSNFEPELSFNNYLTFSLKFSGFSYDSFDFNNYNGAKTPLDGLNDFFVSYEMLLKDYFGVYGELQVKDYNGATLFLAANYRSGKKGIVKDDAVFFARMGIKLLKSDFHDNLKALISISLGKGNLFSSFFRLNADGFSFVPWIPGYVVQDDASFGFQGQWRFGSLGLFVAISNIAREEDEISFIYKNYLNEVVLGIPFFKGKKKRVLFYLKHQNKKKVEFIPVGDGYDEHEKSKRESLSLGFDISGAYRNGIGKLFGYSFGVEFVIEQKYWEEGFFDTQTIDEFEIGFYWSSSFSL